MISFDIHSLQENLLYRRQHPPKVRPSIFTGRNQPNIESKNEVSGISWIYHPVCQSSPGWHDIFQGSIPIPKPSFPTIASWEGAISQAVISLYGDLSVFLQFLRWRLPKYEMQPLYKRQRLLQSRPCQTNKRHLEIRCWRSSRNFPTATWFHKPTLVPWDWKTSWKCKMYIN